MSSTGIAVGIQRGFPVEKRAKVARPSHAKAVRIYIEIVKLNELIICLFLRDFQREPRMFVN